jgi:pilus assembly protein CpaC
LLHCKVIEVSRTKLRDFGFDWVNVSSNGSDYISQSVSGLITGLTRSAADGPITGATGTGSIVFGVVDSSHAFLGVLQAMQQNDIAKILAEPTLVAYSGRPAFFESGGDVPVPVVGALGVQGIDYKPYGTRLDFVPIVLGNGRIRLEVRPRVSEIDPANSFTVNGSTAPGFRRRTVDTGVEMSAGQTFALAGILYNRQEGRKVGIPWLMDVPVVGMAFGRNRQLTNEIELVVLVRPEFVSPMDPCEVPACGPGMSSDVPGDIDLYIKRHMEVPAKGGYAPEQDGVPHHAQPEEVPAGEPVIISDQAVRKAPTRPVTKPQPAPQVASKPTTKRVPKSKPSTAKSPTSSSSTTVTSSPRRNKTSTTNNPSQAAPANGETQGPAFIGPTGYDVLN